MSNTRYERIPLSPSDEDLENVPFIAPEPIPEDPRFNPPTPAPWKRALLLLTMFFLFWLSYKIRSVPLEPEVIHADRYSNEYKYRPAASPVVTETLKDGRKRLRGANPSVHRGRTL